MSVEKNLEVATKYHDLDPKDMDEILGQDFKGEHYGGEHSWDLASHKANWSKRKAEDIIHEQFGEDDKVCTRFTRKMVHQDKPIEIDMMHVKNFKDGKIVHIWECYNPQQA